MLSHAMTSGDVLDSLLTLQLLLLLLCPSSPTWNTMTAHGEHRYLAGVSVGVPSHSTAQLSSIKSFPHLLSHRGSCLSHRVSCLSREGHQRPALCYDDRRDHSGHRFISNQRQTKCHSKLLPSHQGQQLKKRRRSNQSSDSMI
jgi:hypothetical protein